MRVAGTEAEIIAYNATCTKAMGHPTPGREVGKGCHVQDGPGKVSLGLVTVKDLDGNDYTYEAWETLHGAHVPFTTKEWDTPRKHPTKELWDCEAMPLGLIVRDVTPQERASLATAWAGAKVATADWAPAAQMVA